MQGIYRYIHHVYNVYIYIHIETCRSTWHGKAHRPAQDLVPNIKLMMCTYTGMMSMHTLRADPPYKPQELLKRWAMLPKNLTSSELWIMTKTIAFGHSWSTWPRLIFKLPNFQTAISDLCHLCFEFPFITFAYENIFEQNNNDLRPHFSQGNLSKMAINLSCWILYVVYPRADSKHKK